MSRGFFFFFFHFFPWDLTCSPLPPTLSELLGQSDSSRKWKIENTEESVGLEYVSGILLVAYEQSQMLPTTQPPS